MINGLGGCGCACCEKTNRKGFIAWPDVTVSSPRKISFGSFPPGRYEMRYCAGAYQNDVVTPPDPSHTWGVFIGHNPVNYPGPPSALGFGFIWWATATAGLSSFGNYPAGGYPGAPEGENHYATQADAEANLTPTGVRDFKFNHPGDGSGGSADVYLNFGDDPWTDNANGSPNPTFALYSIPYIELVGIDATWSGSTITAVFHFYNHQPSTWAGTVTLGANASVISPSAPQSISEATETAFDLTFTFTAEFATEAFNAELTFDDGVTPFVIDAVISSFLTLTVMSNNISQCAHATAFPDAWAEFITVRLTNTGNLDTKDLILTFPEPPDTNVCDSGCGDAGVSGIFPSGQVVRHGGTQDIIVGVPLIPTCQTEIIMVGTNNGENFPDMTIPVEPITGQSADFFADADGSIAHQIDFLGPVILGDAVPPAVVAWHWDFGDGAADDLSGDTVNHLYAGAGTYHVSLTTTDACGHTTTTAQDVVVT